MKRAISTVTAYHEAGHAVAAWASGYLVESIDVRSRNDSAGCTHTSLPGQQHMALPKRFEELTGSKLDRLLRMRASPLLSTQVEDGIRCAVVLLAGSMAEAKFSRRGFIRVCERGGSDDIVKAEAYCRLLSTRNGGDAHEIARAVTTVARKIVGTHWATISDVATSLLARGFLDFANHNTEPPRIDGPVDLSTRILTQWG